MCVVLHVLVIFVLSVLARSLAKLCTGGKYMVGLVIDWPLWNLSAWGGSALVSCVFCTTIRELFSAPINEHQSHTYCNCRQQLVFTFNQTCMSVGSDWNWHPKTWGSRQACSNKIGEGKKEASLGGKKTQSPVVPFQFSKCFCTGMKCSGGGG